MNPRVVNSELPFGALIGTSDGGGHIDADDVSHLDGMPMPSAHGAGHGVASACHRGLVPLLGRSTPSRSGSAAQPSVSLLSRAGTLLGTVGITLLPKCPACWSVYAGLSGWLGLGIALDEAALLPLTLVCLGLTLLVLASGARRTRRYAPLACAGLAAVGVYAGKFCVDSALLSHASLAVLVFAALQGRRAESCSKLAQHA